MSCIKKYPVSVVLDGFAICQIQKPLLDDTLWVRGFTGFKVDGMQIHVK